MPTWKNDEKAPTAWKTITTAEAWLRQSGLSPTFSDVAFDPSAGRGGVLMPVNIPRAMTVKKLYVLNGTVVSGLAALSMYRSFSLPSYVLGRPISYLFTTAPFAQVGTSVWQAIDIPDVFLAAGEYGLVFTANNGTTKTLCVKAVGPSGEQGFWGQQYGFQFPNSGSFAIGGGGAGRGMPLLGLGGVA